MKIPLDEGFTVVTGPNGSGKSNILDGVLFCLGLANSRGMRAERLPDLVNSGVLRAGKSAETEVSVRFDLTDWEPDPAEEGLEPPQDGPWIRREQKEWTVTRRLRVMPGGSYSSSYSADGEACNLQQLQTQLRRLRVDPEGSNVVMQGDVTRIVSMSNRDRRGLIDELAGVALFDNRIEQTRRKLDDVQERQERCRIVEQELVASRQRLERDCAKARTYQELKEKLHLGRKQELVLAFEEAKKSLHDLSARHQKLCTQEISDVQMISESEKNLLVSVENLNKLQKEVKALGEDQLITVQADLAGVETQVRELDRQAILHKQEGEKLQDLRSDLLDRRKKIQSEGQKRDDVNNKKSIEIAEQSCRDAEAAVEVSRRRLGDVAGRSGAWFEEQKKRTEERQKLQCKLAPLQQEQQKLEERLLQDASRKKELEVDQDRDTLQNLQVHQKLESLEGESNELIEKIKNQKLEVQKMVEDLAIQQRTRSRLEQEQTRLERDIARLESRKETLQESRGTSALQLLLEAGLEGIHGLVAHLGEVEESHRLALEVAAGGRLGQVVVDNDGIAAKAIQLLKDKRAGRLTFLPLNRLKVKTYNTNPALMKGNSPNLDNRINGLIATAFELVKFEPIYKDVFAYVFGETLVFKDLNSARFSLGRARAVTLDGELLEKSGAMTGGSFSGRSVTLSFGRSNEADEVEPIRRRLLELGETLAQCLKEESRLVNSLDEARPFLRKLENHQAGLDAERLASTSANGPLLDRRKERSERLEVLIQNAKDYQKRLQTITAEIQPIVLQLSDLDEKEYLSQANGDSANWQALHEELEVADANLVSAREKRDLLLTAEREYQLSLERLEDQQNALLTEESRLQELVQALSIAHSEWKEQHKDLHASRLNLEASQKDLLARLGEKRRARDVAEEEAANKRQKFQEAQWKLERLRDDIQSMEEELRIGNIRLNELEKSLPNPLPEISDDLLNAGLKSLQNTLEELQKRIEALEPVNMLALEELEKIDQRLGDLEERLEILTQERSELLLRIETVATLRQEAFMEAFEAVDSHFREIFASLSDGDGHLQLDNKDDPLEGGLTLVAHPKGKAVRRLAAMSGGEKSLTALSFLFALQRFRPSPFYALDEVDSFLDGVNVERLSSLIARQAEHAQFLVVSHRRPMIGASSRTIGVTQARGAHTQVVGLPDAA